jgi:16S rRNA (cytosine1402-N4)-methyltransferase
VDGVVSVHVPVMMTEVLSSLKAQDGGRFLDCTFGGGGHSRAIRAAHHNSTVVGIDRDIRAVRRAHATLDEASGIEVLHGTFADVLRLSQGERFEGVLADLGLSTDQLKEGRGFSFRDDGMLDMRMNEENGITAEQVVNQASPAELSRILRTGGAGKDSHRIAQEIVRRRPFRSGKELGDCIAGVVRQERGQSHPATVVFQALRIEVNQEFAQLERLLESAPLIVKPGGRLVIIAFHSLEDMLVTRVMRKWASGDTAPANWRGGDRDASVVRGRLLTKQPLVPTEDEILRNPASRSARVRVFEFAT